MSRTLQYRTLIIEANSEIAGCLESGFTAQGFKCTTAQSGREGLEKFSSINPDLILLDSSIPEGDCYDICRNIRSVSQVPLLITSCRHSEEDCVTVLDVGADDYILKSLSMREMVARAHAILRRAGAEPFFSKAKAIGIPENKLTVGAVSLDLESCRITIAGKTHSVTPNEFRLLAILMRSPDKIFARDELRKRVWPSKRQSLHLVEVHIANLRIKIEEDAHHPKRLLTVRSQGYTFTSKQHVIN